MNTHKINRLLSRREKDGSSHERSKSQDKSVEKGKKTKSTSSEGFLGSLFQTDSTKNYKKEYAQQIAAVKLRLQAHGYTSVEDGQIVYAVNSQYADGDLDKAFDLIILFQQSVEGIIKPYDPNVQMKGAENRKGATCYLDSLLFSMFARLGSFEPLLYANFEGEKQRRLSTLIRLWVNMLRSGMLIQTDITKFLQDALGECGWVDAATDEQQDTADAFRFITESLNLPMLTLKMDIYHHGAEDDKDDHKIIQERLLEVAVPDEEEVGSRGIKLEDCLESYFNNRIEIKRHLARSNTLSSVHSGYDPDWDKSESQHVEVREISSPNTPISPGIPNTPLSPGGRLRAASIIRSLPVDDEKTEDNSDTASTRGSVRKGSVSVRKEVLMPAWQFFNLIPWYTRERPTVPPADVATNFAQTRPVLGICLKRYGVDSDMRSFRKNTFIDIPLDIRLPHFIQDDTTRDGPSMGNFKLSLQSVICHRGQELSKGHYVSFVRISSQAADGDIESNRRLSNGSDPPNYSADRWLKFDDFCTPRVQEYDIERALKEEMPYLLFYQVQPTNDGSRPSSSELKPPSYTDSGIGMQQAQSTLSLGSQQGTSQPGYFDGANTPTIRLSSEQERPSEPRKSLTLPAEERRGSIAFTDTSLNSTASSIVVVSTPATPSEESTAQRMSRAAQRFTKSGSKSRPTSSSGEGRLSFNLQRTLNMMKSKDQLSKIDINKADASKETVASPDGAGDRRSSLSAEETLKAKEGSLNRSKSKKGKKRDKSKGPSDSIEHGHQHGHHHKAKGKDGVPDRECIVM